MIAGLVAVWLQLGLSWVVHALCLVVLASAAAMICLMKARLAKQHRWIPSLLVISDGTRGGVTQSVPLGVVRVTASKRPTIHPLTRVRSKARIQPGQRVATAPEVRPQGDAARAHLLEVEVVGFTGVRPSGLIVLC